MLFILIYIFFLCYPQNEVSMLPSNNFVTEIYDLQPQQSVGEPATVNWKGRIVVLWSGLGEYAWAKRLEEACEKLNWKCFVAIDPAELSEYDRLVQDKQTTPEEIRRMIEIHAPDCTISLKWDRVYSDKVPHYLASTGVFSRLFDQAYNQGMHFRLAPEGGKHERVENFTDSEPRQLLSFAGVLHTTPNTKAFENFFIKHHKSFHALPWYPSCSATEYKPVKAERIFHSGFQWDEKRNGAEYRKMFSLLDAEGCLDIYGPAHKWDCTPNSVRGMTFDPKEFQKAMQASGIALILHNSGNLENGAPAARIFEAAAAGCVIISDQHPFIIREFGDSILYVDQNLPAEALFKQIIGHRQWILDHPEKAEAMAKKAHQIFAENFTLEKQLQDFKAFHLQIMQGTP